MSFVVKAQAQRQERVEYDPIKQGTHPAILYSIVGIGKQPIDEKYKFVETKDGRTVEKQPKDAVVLTFEVKGQDITNQDGEVLPRVISTAPLTLSLHQKSKLFTYLKSIDPALKHTEEAGFEDIDVTGYVGSPCTVNIVQRAGTSRDGKQKIYANLSGVGGYSSSFPALGDSVNAPIVFDFYNPNAEVLARIPKFVRGYMEKAVNFAGSDTEKALKKIAEATATDKQGDLPWKL